MAKKKSKSYNNRNTYDILMALLYILIGALMCIFKTSILGWIMTAAGVLLIVFGALKILKQNDLIFGIVYIVVGVAIIVSGWSLVWLALLVLGVLLIVYSAIDFFGSSRHGLFGLIKLIVSVAVGVMLIVNGFASLDILFIVIGVILIIDGVLYLIGAISK